MSTVQCYVTRGAVTPPALSFSWAAGSTANLAFSWSSVAWNGANFCAISANSFHAITSPDGATWTDRTMTDTANWKYLVWSGSSFVAIALSSGKVARSATGQTWSVSTQLSAQMWRGLVSNGTRIFTIADNMGGIFYSDNHGVSWAQIPNVLPIQSWTGLAVSGSTLVCFSDSTIWVSTNNGVSGNYVTPPSEALSQYSIMTGMVHNGNEFCVTSVSADNLKTLVATSPDGITWTHKLAVVKNNVKLPSSASMASNSNGIAIIVGASGTATKSLHGETVAAAIEKTIPSGGYLSVAYAPSLQKAVALGYNKLAIGSYI